MELKYYLAGSVRIAMRVDGNITWLLTDHLGSTSVTVDATGNLLTSLKYTAFGEIRSGDSLTDYQYTGQRNESEIGLYYYIARYYDPQLGRFISADTIIPEPGSSKAYDRYSYVNNNPINFNDPSGHWVDTVLDIAFIAYDIHDIQANGLTWGSGLSLAADVAGAIIPVATGLGVGVRAAFKAANAVDNAADIARTINAADNLVDTGKTVDPLVDAGHSVDNLVRDASEETVQEATGGVYRLVDNETGKTMRTGRTKDLEQRRQQHGRNPTLEKYDFIAVERTDDCATQRGLEQIIYEKYNAPLDFRRPISLQNP